MKTAQISRGGEVVRTALAHGKTLTRRFGGRRRATEHTKFPCWLRKMRRCLRAVGQGCRWAGSYTAEREQPATNSHEDHYG